MESDDDDDTGVGKPTIYNLSAKDNNEQAPCLTLL